MPVTHTDNPTPNKPSRHAWWAVGAPIAGLMLAAIALAFAAFADFAREQDRAFEDTSRRLVASALEGKMGSLADTTFDYANWNDAFNAITLHWNPAWVRTNYYSSVADGLVVFRDDGSTRYVWFSETTRSQQAALAPLAIDAATSLPNLRDLSRAPTAPGIVSRSYVWANGELILLAFAPITPEDNARRVSRDTRIPQDYLALVKIVDGPAIAAIGRSLALRDMKFMPDASGEPADAARVDVALVGPRHEAIGRLSWINEHPGSATLLRRAAPVLAGLIIFGFLTLLVAWHLVSKQIQAVARAKAAVAASRQKSEFIANVTHELRTPLNAIIGYAEIIQEENPHGSLQKDATEIVAAARHLGRLVNDIIDQSRLDAGHVELHFERLPVEGLLTEVRGLLASTAQASGNEFRVSAGAGADFVVADHARLRQCLVNLASNALKFTQGGVVSIDAHAGANGQGRDMIVFTINDNGRGISSADLATLFRPFTSTGGLRSGLGLGLSISRELARAMGGDLWVESEQGQGSTFTLSMPATIAHLDAIASEKSRLATN